MLPVSEGWQRFHPLTPLLTAGRLVAIGAFLASQQLAQVTTDRLPLLLLGGGLVLVGSAFVYGYISWQVAGYRLTADQLEIRKGILFKSRGNIPIARIESVDVAQKPIPRVLGLAEVNVEVASQGGSEGHLRYLSVEEAELLRRRLEAARRSQHPAAGAEGHETRPRRHLAQVSDRDLLFAYGALPAAIAVVALIVLLAVLALEGARAVLATGAFTLLALAAGVVTQLRRVDRLAGFALSRDDEELHVTRGFLEKLSQQIPLARIQAIRIEEPWLWRKFGRARLLVSVAGYRGADDARAAATAMLMPIARRADIDVLVASLGGPLADQVEMTRPPDSARWRSPVMWRHIGIGHTPGFTVARRGWLRRRIDFVTAEKLQSLRLTDGPWQRRLGLATLHLDTAGPGIAVVVPHLGVEVAHEQLWITRGGAVEAAAKPLS